MSILSRLFRRGPDTEATNAVIDMLAKRNVSGESAEDGQRIVRELSFPRGTRALAVIDLEAGQAPLQHVIASRIGGDAAGHSGRITVTGIHVTLDRRALPDQWPARWATAIHAQPDTAREGVGEARDFAWRPLDATGAGASDVVELLTGNERVARWVSTALREPGIIHVEVVPSASLVRVAAHRTGEGLPYPTTVDAVVTVARAIAGAA
ncbi:MAG: hypothetical protein OXN86_06140 [Chloroflexota bacterium]|nr:hypothetical protein [Chloroflexota bacterium]